MNQPQIAAAMIREMYPTATRYGVSSSDQGRFGYTLSDVSFDDGTVITHDSGTFAALAEEVEAEVLADLSWGAFGDRNADSEFDVDIDTGRIIRAADA